MDRPVHIHRADVSLHGPQVRLRHRRASHGMARSPRHPTGRSAIRPQTQHTPPRRDVSDTGRIKCLLILAAAKAAAYFLENLTKEIDPPWKHESWSIRCCCLSYL